jgi:hypothetical protein
MPSDYTAIREANIRQYGEGVRHLAFLGKLYADRTHFIFELLQNAEDAGASCLTFDLESDRLEVRHDGRPFTTDDVISICGVDDSTKTDELTAIGKFGIGFKSVYAYTWAPEIHSADEHFRIEHYVRPYGADPSRLPPQETLFVFPFDRDDVPAVMAHQEILRALQELNPVALLFLHAVHEVRIRVGGEDHDHFRRMVNDADSQIIDVVHTRDGRVVAHPSWLRFSRPLAELGRPRQHVELAWRRTVATANATIERTMAAPLIAFFPTERTTELGFLLQAPFRTTPSRDNIAEQDEWNRKLIAQAATLLVDTLVELGNTGRLGLDMLQALPLQLDYFPPNALLRPIFDTLLDAFNSRPLLPTANGAYATAGSVRLARGTGLRELLSPAQLATLTGAKEPVDWLPETITENRTPLLWRYLRNTVEIDELTPEWLISRLSAEDLATAPDSWLIQLYAFLKENPALWRTGTRSRWEAPGPARRSPIVRLNDGRMTPPFSSTGQPLAYLPGPIATTFPIVRTTIASDPAARFFLEALGLTEPDATAEVLETILPAYGSDDPHLTTEQHAEHLDTIARAVSAATGETRIRLLARLRETRFLLAVDGLGGNRRYCRPGDAYWFNDDLAYYFAPEPVARFLGAWHAPWRATLDELGVADRVRWIARRPNSLGQVILASEYASHERGLDGFDPDFQIDGLISAIKHSDPQRAAYVWNNLLVPNIARLRGVVESATRQDYSNARRQERLSIAAQEVTAHAWLPAPLGDLATPGELSMDDLPESFTRSPALAAALGMISAVVEEASQQLGLSSELLRFLANDPDARKELERRAQQALHARQTDRAPAEDLEFADALRLSFERPAEYTPSTEFGHASGAVANAELRRERTHEDITAAQQREPARSERFRRVPRRVWDSKDSTVRHFLLEQYKGCCQVCAQTFLKRDGVPYFEGLHLVPYTDAAWHDRPGGVLCLCATCCSKFLYGPVEADDVVVQVTGWHPRVEGGTDAELHVELCGEPTRIRYTEKHLLDLQEMIKATLDKPTSSNSAGEEAVS